MVRRQIPVEPLFRPARLQMVLVRIQHRRRLDHAPPVPDRNGYIDVAAGLSARRTLPDGFHARLPGEKLPGRRSDAHFRSAAQFLPAHGILCHVPRQPGLPGEKMQYITEASFVYHTPIGPVSLSLTKYDLKSLAQYVPHFQLRLRDLRSQRAFLLIISQSPYSRKAVRKASGKNSNGSNRKQKIRLAA